LSSPDALPKVPGGVPMQVRHIFLGASLHAISKQGGRLRPIAVGLTLRRLSSKVANRWATERMVPLLAPRQLGVGVRGGAEAIVHAARSYISSASPYHAIVKLDFENAFNTVRRDCILSRWQPMFLGFYTMCYPHTRHPQP